MSGEKASERKFIVKVETLSQKTIKFDDVGGSTTGAQLVSLISAALGVPSHNMRLTYKGEDVEPAKKLEDFADRRLVELKQLTRVHGGR